MAEPPNVNDLIDRASQFESEERFLEAGKTYLQIRKKIQQLLMEKYENRNENLEVSKDTKDYKKSKYWYGKAGQAFYWYFQKSYDVIPKKKRKKLVSLINKYLELGMDGGFDEDTAEDILDDLDKLSLKKSRQEYNFGYSLSLEFVSWQDSLTLSPNGGGTSSEIFATTTGWCIGAGAEYRSYYFNFTLDGCFALAKASVGNESATVSYFQSGVPVNAIFIRPGAHYQPATENISLGISLPIISKSGDYTEPSGFTLDNQKLTSFGFLIEGSWKYKSFLLSLKGGKLFKQAGTLWFSGTSFVF